MTRKTLLVLLSLLFVISISSNILASNGTQIGTVGARSTSMGSCFRGLADDWSAVFFNPAGLTQLNSRFTIGGSMGLIMPRGTYSPYQLPSVPFTGLNLTEIKATPKNFPVPSGGFFFKPSERFVFGIGVFAPFGLGAEWDIYDVPSNYGNTNAISKKNEHFSDHQVINIQPTIGFKLTDRISIGLGLSYIWGKMILDQVVLPYNPTLGIWTDPTNPLNALVALGVIPPLSTDQYRLIVENNLDGSGCAYGANVGILVNVTDKFSIGLSGRYHTDLALKGDLTQTMAFPKDDNIVAAINALVPTYLTQQQAAQITSVFSGQNVETKYKVTANLPLPWTIGAGLAYKVCPSLTITADASLTNWESWGDITVKVENGDNVTLKQEWKNTLELGGGFEWMAINNSSSQFFVRGGFYTVDTPAPDKTMSPTILDPNRRYVITGGVGLDLGTMAFNLACEYVLFGDKDIKEYNVDTTTGVPENYAGKYKFHALVVTFGATIGL